MKSKEQRQKEARERRCKDYWYWSNISANAIMVTREYREQNALGIVSYIQSKIKSAERDIENLNRKLGTVGLT